MSVPTVEERENGQATTISSEILEKFYERVWPLEKTLDHLIEGGFRKETSDTAEGLSELLVASSRAFPVKAYTKIEEGSVFTKQADLIAHVQRTLFAQRDTRQEHDWKSPPSIIAQGYKIRPARDGGIGQLVMEWPNSAVEELKKPVWSSLLLLVGEEVMLYLLKECSIFQHIAADCWIQLTGQSVMELKEIKNDIKGKSTFYRSPSQIVFVRSRMFYNQAHMTESTHHVTKKTTSDSKKATQFSSTLSSTHILHRLFLPQKNDFVHLSKYILPLEFRLNNVVTTSTDYAITTQPLMDYGNREKELRQALKRPIPKRVRPFLKTAKWILKQHRKCHYRQALDYFCPIHGEKPVNMTESGDVEIPLAIPSLVATTQHVICSTLTLSGHTDHSLENKMRSTIKPKFADYTTPARLVSFFAKSIIRYLLPLSLFGSQHNFDLVLSKVDAFIRLRRFESQSLHEALQGIRIQDIRWAASATKSSRRCLSDSVRQRSLVSEVIFWIFDGLLMPLLRSNFYITESSAFKNETLYFRKETWLTISQPIIHQLSETIFQRLERAQLDAYMTHRKLGISFVRLLPKSSGVRPIINLRRRIAKKGSKLGPSINTILQPAAAVLNFIRRSDPQALGSSCFGMNDIYDKLKASKPQLAGKGKLYFVKLDIKSCYDQIVQGTLLKLVNDLISDDEYLVQKFARLHKIASKVKRKYILRAYDGDADYPNFRRIVHDEAAKNRHSIFADSMTYSHKSRGALLELIDEHITRNSIKIGANYYHQSIGIAQGSILSSMLCSLHFGHMENKHLKYLSGSDSLLMRLIDDFLLVTTDKHKATQFLQHMHLGFPSYGCTIAQDKTLTNFAVAVGGYKIPQLEGNHFPWCGILIETNDLSIRSEVSRFTIGKMVNTLTIETCRNPGEAFLTKMKHSIKQKMHRIYLDPDLNDPRTVLENIFSTMVVVAMKLVSYTRTGLSSSAKFKQDPNYLLSAVTSLIDYCLSFLKSQTSVMRRTTDHTASLQWRKREVELLSWQAFRLAVSKKQSRFRGLLILIQSNIKKIEKDHPEMAKSINLMPLDGVRDLVNQVKY